MNKIVKKFLLAEGKFIPKWHLIPSRFNYSACGPFTKHCERIRKVRETGNLNIYIGMYQIKLVLRMILHILKVKVLANSIISKKVLKDRAYKIARNPCYVVIKEDQQARCISVFT